MIRTMALCMGAAAATLAISMPAAAHDKLRHISCEQFLAMEPGAQNNVVYWIEGAATASNEKTVAAEDIRVGYDRFGRPVAEVVTACQADKNASLMDKIKRHF